MTTTIEEDILNGTSTLLTEGTYRGIPFVGVKHQFACGYAVLPNSHPLCIRSGDITSFDFFEEGKCLSVTYLRRETWQGEKRWIAGFSSNDDCFLHKGHPNHSPSAEEMTLRCHQFIDELLAE